MERHNPKLKLVLVEGITDKGVIDAIGEKLGIQVKTLLMRGNNPSKAIRIIKARLVEKEYDKVIILKDLHKLPENKVMEHLNKIAKNVQELKVQGIIVRKAIESWILAGMGVNNPEEIDDPAETLNTYMMRRGKRYIKSYKAAKELVMEINLEKAAKTAKSLNSFIETLKDP